MKQVHGHEMINLIIQANKPLNISQIKDLAEQAIGTDVSYHTCSDQGMNTEEMIRFLLDRNKLIDKGEGYVIDTGEVCEDR